MEKVPSRLKQVSLMSTRLWQGSEQARACWTGVTGRSRKSKQIGTAKVAKLEQVGASWNSWNRPEPNRLEQVGRAQNRLSQVGTGLVRAKKKRRKG
jgi:hypothetical protein